MKMTVSEFAMKRPFFLVMAIEYRKERERMSVRGFEGCESGGDVTRATDFHPSSGMVEDEVNCHQATSPMRGGSFISIAAVTAIGRSRLAAAASTKGQYFAGMPRRPQWIANRGETSIASARGRIPPKASITSE